MAILFFQVSVIYIAWRTGQGLYKLITMVDAGGTRTRVHLHVSRPLYRCATDALVFMQQSVAVSVYFIIDFRFL